MSELTKRVVSGVVFGPLVALLFYFLPPSLFFLFLVLVLLGALYEFISLTRIAWRFPVLILSFLALLPLYGGFLSGYLLWLFLSPVLCLLLAILFQAKEGDAVNERTARALIVMLLSEVFIVLPLFFLYRLKELDTLFPLILLFTIWASDTGAYIVGKRFGKRRLVPFISPGKTLEGLAGALLGSLLLTVLFRTRMAMGITESCLIGITIGLLGQMGDIFESVGKRVCGVKDSSTIIPGHGGILDRIDSFLFTSPFVYHYLTSIKG